MDTQLLSGVKNIFGDSTNKQNEKDKEIMASRNLIIAESKLANEQIQRIKDKYDGGPELSAEEKNLSSFFVGCYLDDPNNRILENNLGIVRNQLECIKMGQANNYKYVGLVGGDKCWAGNNNNISQMKRHPKNKCDIICDDGSAGYCGGPYAIQIYSTDILQKDFKKDNLLEEFLSTDAELKVISENITQSDMTCTLPLNKYILLVSLLIIVLLIYMVLEHMNKRE
jgi:hypothetical protein